jgi:hypothetical protein
VMRAIVKDESVLSTSCPRGFFLEFYLRSESENNGGKVTGADIGRQTTNAIAAVRQVAEEASLS